MNVTLYSTSTPGIITIIGSNPPEKQETKREIKQILRKVHIDFISQEDQHDWLIS